MSSSDQLDLATRAFIRAHGLPALFDQLHISSKRHGQFPQLIQLKYNQRESPMDHPVVQECRGLILDECDDFRVVAFPFTKFFNLGEPLAAALDWSTARVQEKLDGSLMVLYSYHHEWRVASSSLPDAAGSAHAAGMTFAQLFWQVWKQMGYALPPISENACFMFELMTPHNRIVVRQDESRIVLHGVRNLQTFREEDPSGAANRFGWQCARSFPLTCADDCVAAAAVLKPTESEGFVVADAQFNRLKIKSPNYVALSLLKYSMTPRGLLEIARNAEASEFLTYFPEFQPEFQKMQLMLVELAAALSAEYASIAHIDDPKAYALAAQKTRSPAVMFALHQKKHRTPMDFFATCTIPFIERALGLKAPDAVISPQD